MTYPANQNKNAWRIMLDGMEETMEAELPINAEEQYEIGKYRFVVYPQAGDTFAIKCIEKNGESFWLSHAGTSRFECPSGYRGMILMWLETQTFIGDSI